jgi:signal transduction histidine kinase
MTVKADEFFWSVHPARGLIEAWLISLLILVLLSWQVGIVSPFVLSNGLMLLCGISGMWAVLRIRIPRGSWLRQGIWELAIGFSLSIVMALGMRLPAYLLGWEGVWLQSTLAGASLATLLFLGTGPGYAVARGGVRIWLLWDRLRRQRMLWALTHAQLAVVVLVITMIAVGLLCLFPLYPSTQPSQPGTGPLVAITERLLHTVFPAMAMILVMTMVILLALLLPSALVSYLVARKTTRRLETLVNATKALREGQYDARIQVVGEDEVAQLQADFNAMADDLERTMQDLEVQRDAVAHLLQSRRELVANVSHELRTPVATMRATLESALNEEKEIMSPSLQHDLEVAHSEGLRLQRLIDELFTLSQAEVDGLVLECRATDVVPIVQRMVDAMAPLAWQSGRVEVVAKAPPDLSWACVDEARLEQMLANLLRNSVRHTPPGGIVAVVASESTDTLLLQVRDTGEGITPEDLPHIWERFYRSEHSRARDGGGAGLGLALVKELCEAMGGSVAVKSELGQGSCFTLTLPKA